MKKVILKFFGLAALAALMIVNIQFFQADNSSDISLAYFENTVYAQSEGGGNGWDGDCWGCDYGPGVRIFCWEGGSHCTPVKECTGGQC